jgi:hypothetical protein
MPTTARLKYDIDRGRGGDKVDNIDPAAAPLGTDDEAAGNPPSPAEIKLAARHEIGNSVSSGGASGDYGVTVYVVMVLVWSAAVLSAIVFLKP